MRKYYLAVLVFVSLFGCQNGGEEKKNVVDSAASLNNVVKDTVTVKTESPVETPAVVHNGQPVQLPKIDTTGKAARDQAMKKADIQVKIFPNTENGGFGYDIVLDGHTYVHQPNVPALPGNKGFETEKKAKKVAQLVSFKIRNNIMPPTVDVKELDSLGVK